MIACAGQTNGSNPSRQVVYGKKDERGLDTALSVSRMETMDGTLNSRLSMITLPDADGKELRFGSLWVRQPAVIVFLRHYG